MLHKLRAILTVLVILLVISIFSQYFIGGLSRYIIEVLLWLTIIVYIIYLFSKIKAKKKEDDQDK
ncbi:Ca2+/Na+ antiporter [Scopulibacillus daqui]|uniref:Ca2+/Na+ antiporter n=1 Tax=Scopulibacillus daqui TaxID=1469162 RepID=A0ABS2PVE7_9BACL|nr:hypothetical protein [Scopulibacillus daqui]MBM7644028.1 Ca2+/Na+ antiporter [Scopulibacillus daqui]